MTNPHDHDENLLREAFHAGAENGYLFGGEGEALTVDHLDELFEEWCGAQTGTEDTLPLFDEELGRG